MDAFFGGVCMLDRERVVCVENAAIRVREDVAVEVERDADRRVAPGPTTGRSFTRARRSRVTCGKGIVA